MQFVPATTVEEVIERLERIIDQAIEQNDPIGYFPALYVVVTEKVRDGIRAGNVFEDNARMEKLDVFFANRYLEAYHQYKHGQELSTSWKAAFKAAENGKNQMILQYLLMGMNAHINLDLGIAAAEAESPEKFESLKTDFFTINQLLFDLVDEVKSDLECYSPRFGWILKIVPKEDAILKFSISKARDAAWDFAQKLAGEPRPAWEESICNRDKESEVYAALIRRPGLLGLIVIWWVRKKESKDVARAIQDLRANYGQSLMQPVRS